MPIYEYLCEDCGASLEVLESVGSLEERECDRCGGHAYRVFSVPAPPVIQGAGGTAERIIDKYRWKPKPGMFKAPSVHNFSVDRSRLWSKAGLND